MDPRRWEEVQATFDALVELDAAERASRLAALGAADPELRAAVGSLLAADAEADARLAPLESPFLSPAPPPDLLGLAGRTISHFQVIEPLGAGGMGVVYRAEDTRLGRSVALKFLLPQSTLDAVAKARFLREARSAAALDHPNLCTIHEVGESEDGHLFLAMALYPGETLNATLEREGRLSVGGALGIARQIAQGLACAHAAEIVHRDLKPGNVMLLPDGTAKILDFGLAKARDQSLTGSGAILGTVSYMAPEQILGDPVDGRADLWALGVVLYEMVIGRKPFVGDNQLAIAHAILHDEPVPPTTLRVEAPAAMDHVVLTLLQKDPRTRYVTVDELIAHLAEAAGAIGESTARGVRTRWLHTRRSRLANRRWLVPFGAVLAIGAVGGPAIARWLRPSPPRLVSRYSIVLPDTEALALAENRYYRIAISPDGERLVYVGTSPDGRSRLWVRKRDQLHATPLAGTEGAVNPFFSPDGTRLGFEGTLFPSNWGLKTISADGGTPTFVTDSGVSLGGAAWGYDGYIYFDGYLPEAGGIARVRETGGAPEPVTITDHANGELWHYQPQPLPNGRGVLFVVRRSSIRESDIAVVDLKSRVHRVLLRGGFSPRYAASGHLIYATANGTLMAAPFDQDKMVLAGKPVALAERVGVIQDVGMPDLAISATGTLVYTTGTGVSKELVWVARDGKATPIDSKWHAGFTSLALSPDGAELAVGVQEPGATDVWIKRLDREPPWKIESDGDFNDFPAWMPDGRAVTFVSNGGSRSNLLDLYVERVDGSTLSRVWHDAKSIEDAEVSRDGQWVVYRTGFDLFAVRTAGDRTPIPLVATRFLEASPRLSPDGRWLAYSSNESGGREVYVRPFPNTGSAKWQVSTLGGADPVWSRSGRELFYKNDNDALVTATVLPGARFAVGEPRVLFKATKYESYYNWRDYDVSPDGSRFVMIRKASQSRDELIFVENFFEQLKTSLKR